MSPLGPPALPPPAPPSAPPLVPSLPGCRDVPAAFGQRQCGFLVEVAASGNSIARLCSSNVDDLVTSLLPYFPEFSNYVAPVDGNVQVFDLCNCTCSAHNYVPAPPAPPVPRTLAAMRGCCTAHHYRIGLSSYSFIPFYNYDPNDRRPPTNGFSGFVPDLIDALSAEMGFSYELLPGTDPQLFTGLLGATGFEGRYPGFPGGSIDFSVSTGDLQAGGEIGGCGVRPSSNCLFDYQSSEVANVLFPGAAHSLLTMPFYTSRFSYLVKVSTSDQTIWRVFEPFTPAVWGAMAVVLISIALLMNLIELLYPSTRRRRERPLRERTRYFVQDFPKALYSTTAACLGGEDYEWAKTWPMRVLRCALLLFIVVLVSTYTANLASFFTRPSRTLHGPRDDYEATNSRICVRHGYISNAIVQRFTRTYDTLPGTRDNPFTEGPMSTSKLPTHEVSCYRPRVCPQSVTAADGPLLTTENGYTIAPEVISAGYDYCLDSIQQERSVAMVDDGAPSMPPPPLWPTATLVRKSYHKGASTDPTLYCPTAAVPLTFSQQIFCERS